jgi:hypothetical protein
MEHVNLPDAISHRQLRAMLQTAQPDPEPLPAGSASVAGPDASNLQGLLKQWSRLSESVMQSLQSPSSDLTEGRSAKQLMALGALQAHLAMALRASSAALEG